MTIQFETRVITPADAQEILAKNTHNRPIRPADVNDYARDMVAGKWRMNGQAIQIAKDGTVLNGQHRLHAVIRADRAAEFLVVTGLEMADQDTIDTGRKRTMANVLAMNGTKNSAVVAAVAARVIRWDMGDKSLTGSHRSTHSELGEWINQNPAVHRSAEIAMATRSSFKGVQASSAGTAHFITSRIDLGASVEFFAQLASGVGLREGDAVLALRNRLTNAMAASENLPDGVRLNMILRAWNGFRTGEKLSKMQTTADTLPIDPK